MLAKVDVKTTQNREDHGQTKMIGRRMRLSKEVPNQGPLIEVFKSSVVVIIELSVAVVDLSVVVVIRIIIVMLLVGHIEACENGVPPPPSRLPL